MRGERAQMSLEPALEQVAAGGGVAGAARQGPEKRLFRYENGLLLILGVTFGIVFIDRNALTTLMPYIRAEFGLSNARIGLLASGLSITWAISGYIVGMLSDRLGRRKPFLVGAVLLFSATTFLSGLASGFASLLCARLLMGVAEGPVPPLAQTLLALESSENRRGFNAGLMQATVTSLIGLIAAPVLLVSIAGAQGWRAAFYVAALPGAVMALVILRFVREPAGARRKRERTVPQLVLMRERNVLLCMLIGICLVSAMVIAWAFLPLYLTEVRGFTPAAMSYVMGGLGVSSALSGLLLPALSDRIGRKPVVVIFSLLGVVTPLGVLYGATALPGTAVLILIGWIYSGIFPIFMATIPAESVPVGSLGAAIALAGGAGELIGGFGGPPLAGLLADHFGLAAPFHLMTALTVIATVLAAALRETHPRKLRG